MKIGPNNDKSHIALNHTMNQFIEKYDMSEDDYKLFELIVIERKPHKNGPQWKFAGAFYYAPTASNRGRVLNAGTCTITFYHNAYFYV